MKNVWLFFSTLLNISRLCLLCNVPFKKSL